MIDNAISKTDCWQQKMFLVNNVFDHTGMWHMPKHHEPNATHTFQVIPNTVKLKRFLTVNNELHRVVA